MRRIGLWSGRLPLQRAYGEARYYLAASAALARAGAPVRWLLSGHESAAELGLLQAHGIPTQAPRLPWPPRRVVSHLGLPLLEWQQPGVELLHLWTTKSAPPTRRPFLLTILDGIALAGEHGERADLHAARRLAAAALSVTTLTHDSAARVRDALGMKELRVTPLGAGVDRARFTPVAGSTDAEVLRRHGLQAGYMICVGGWAPRKGLHVLRDALRRLDVATRPPVAITGEPRLEDAALVQQLRSLDARILGHVPDGDVAPLLRHAAALLLPSLAEGFGLPLLEAQACATPVIASDLPVLREASGGAALHVPVADATALSAAMRELSQRAAALRRAGLENARQHTWEAVAQRLLDVYARAASSAAL